MKGLVYYDANILQILNMQCTFLIKMCNLNGFYALSALKHRFLRCKVTFYRL